MNHEWTNAIARKCERELPPGYKIELTFERFEDGGFECCGELTDANGDDVYVDGEGDFIERAISSAQYDSRECGATYTPPPAYSVGTWDTEIQAFTPQDGLSVPCLNISWRQLLQACRELRRMGYSVHYKRDADGEHEDDPSVLIERTDGRPEAEILRDWLS